MTGWPRVNSIVRGRQTGNHYRMTTKPERDHSGSCVVLALGSNPKGDIYVSQVCKLYYTERDKYEVVWEPGDPFQVGDIVEDKESKAHYRVLDVHDAEVQVVCVKAGGTRGWGLDERAWLLNDKLLLIERPIPSTTTETTTTSEEDNPMDTNHLSTAINNLAAEEAAEAVKPTYGRISRLVRGTKVGEAITTKSRGEGVIPVFYCRQSEGTWIASGQPLLTTEQVISSIVTARVQHKVKVKHLVAK